MKTYESERRELSEWLKKANFEADKKVNNLPERGGYDEMQIRLIVSREWNRRLDELKKKYGKDKVAATQDSEPAEPVTKSRKFGQVIQPV